jgi:hypothetical protein
MSRKSDDQNLPREGRGVRTSPESDEEEAPARGERPDATLLQRGPPDVLWSRPALHAARPMRCHSESERTPLSVTRPPANAKNTGAGRRADAAMAGRVRRGDGHDQSRPRAETRATEVATGPRYADDTPDPPPPATELPG